MKKYYVAPAIKIQNIQDIEYCVFCGALCPCSLGCAYYADSVQVNKCLTVLYRANK